MGEDKKTISKMPLSKVLDHRVWPHSVNAPLAEAIGLHEALIVEYIHRWIHYRESRKEKSGKYFHEGRMWMYKTLSDWLQEFPFMSLSTLQRALHTLQTRKVIMVGRFNRMKIDRTLWYSLNYDLELQVKMTTSNWSNRPHPSGQNDHMDVVKMNRPTIEKEQTEKQKEKTPKSASLRESEKRGLPLRVNPPPHEPPAEYCKNPVRSKDESMDIEMTQRTFRSRRKASLAEKISKNGKTSVTVALDYWKTLLSSYEVTSHVSLTKKEVGLFKTLMQRLDEAKIPVAEFLEFVVANWDAIRRKLTWPDNPKKFRLGEHPFFQEVWFNWEDLVRLWEKGLEPKKDDEGSYTVYTRVEDVPKDIPNYARVVSQIQILGSAKIRRSHGA